MFNSFKKLPTGYYRLLVVGWIFAPLIIALFTYFLTYLSRHNDKASENAITWFLITSIAYYPIICLFLWVREGFIIQKSDVNHLPTPQIISNDDTTQKIKQLFKNHFKLILAIGLFCLIISTAILYMMYSRHKDAEYKNIREGIIESLTRPTYFDLKTLAFYNNLQRDENYLQSKSFDVFQSEMTDSIKALSFFNTVNADPHYKDAFNFEDFYILFKPQPKGLELLYMKLGNGNHLEALGCGSYTSFKVKYGSEANFKGLYKILKDVEDIKVPPYDTFYTRYFQPNIQSQSENITNEGITDTSTTSQKLEFDILNGNTRVFDFKDEDKLFGTGISIKYPARMVSLPGDKKRTIRKLGIVDEDNSEFRCVINFQPMKIISGTISEKRNALRKESIKETLNQLGSVLQNFKILDIQDGLFVANEPSSYGEYYCENLKTDGADKPYTICRMYTFFYSSGLGTIQFYLNSKTLKNDKLILKFKTYNSIINRITNSLELHK